MNKKIFIALMMAIGIFGFVSCSEDDVTDTPCSVAWATELQDEIAEMSAAAQAYATDQSPANCNAYKEAAQNYLNALKPYGNCAALTGQSRVAWENALAEAQEDIDDMEC